MPATPAPLGEVVVTQVSPSVLFTWGVNTVPLDEPVPEAAPAPDEPVPESVPPLFQ